MGRGLYTLLVYLVAPLAVLRLAWRGLSAPAYWRRWGERFGYFAPPAGTPSLWLHAVSVGETLAAAPLVRALRERYPGYTLVLTTTTPTGSERVREAFGDEVFHVYFPFDLPGAVNRFLDRTRPRVAVIMETELWPNTLHACRRRDIPVVLANGRLSAQSTRRYRRWIPRLMREMLGDITALAAQGRPDAQRFVVLGADPGRVIVSGNIKFDLRLPASLREQAQVLRREFGTHRPVWIAASTHEGEEEQVLDAFDAVRRSVPDVLLVLVPRHPERFPRAALLCQRQGYRVVLRSEGTLCDERTDVYLGDTMGELPLLYAASDIAFVGGSLVETGGHNLLEPAALGLPVIFGPHMFNFEEISRMLLDAEAGHQVGDAQQLASAVEAYLRDANLRHATGEKGRAMVERNRGALDALMAVIGRYVR